MSKMYDPEQMKGQKFGRLTIVGFSHNNIVSSGDARPYVVCKCDCGKEKTICLYSLIYGLTKSCGCLAKENASNKTHGLSKTRICHIYRDMIRRCEDSRRPSYKNYGGRGIRICDEWRTDFMSFYKWAMANGYRDDLTIDRIEVNGNYEPSNCRWVDYQTQANNTRNNHRIVYNGEEHTLTEWARIKGISHKLLFSRLKRGWCMAEAIGDVEHKRRCNGEIRYTINGETHNIKEWCRIRGLSVDTVRYRREHSWTPEEIFGFKEREKCV